MSLLATPGELQLIVDVESARAWAELPDATWRRVDEVLGGVPGLRVLATLPKGGLFKALQKVRVHITPWSNEERELTPVEMSQVALMWRVARQKFGLVDEDPLNEPGSGVVAAFRPVARARDSHTTPKDTWEAQPRLPPHAYDPVVLGFSYLDSQQELSCLLTRGTDCCLEVPAFRWDHEVLYDPDPDMPGKIYTRHGGFIDGWNNFEGKLFGIERSAVSAIDPQQKKCLEEGANAFHLAGLGKNQLDRAVVGVYVGVMTYDWYEERVENGIATMDDQPHMLASRVSFLLNLKGPSTNIDTACSSSLVACSSAVHAVARKSDDFGLALGVCHMGARKTFVGRCAGHLLSPSGRSFVFSIGGDGYCRGEGHGAVVFGRREVAHDSGQLQPPQVASSTVNEDGKSATLVAPNGPSQQELLRDALRHARLTPAEVVCCECAANGSAMGDPIEFGAISKVQLTMARNDPLVLTSAKSVKGHTEGASGITGIVKCLLMLQDGVATPISHMGSLNANIDDEDANMLFPNECVELFCDDDLKVGVSAFGFGGTNAHTILIA